jgi:MoaA/NifB/PqqE/SkfB family radical SAM enzyme
MIDTTGKVKPCCRFVLDNSAEELNLQSKSIHEIFHSDFMNSLREKSAMGEKIPGCRRCYEEQAGGKRSLRERVNGNSATNVYDLNTPKINYLELAISNDCNLMCRMCSSRFSHKLFDEELQYYGKTQIPEKKTRSNIDAAYNLLDNLLYIKFTGGEPLLIKEHWELLQEAVDRDLAKKITLNYSTNCTIWPKEKHQNIWKHFKNIELCVSLDSIIKEENEYQRYPTNHETALENIKRYVEFSNHSNMIVIGRPTISLMNIMHVPETIEWLLRVGLKSVNVTHLTFPAHQSISVLPVHIKNKIKEKFNNYPYMNNNVKAQCDYLINYMFSEDNSHLLDEFIKHTRFLDRTRNQSFKNSYPYFDFL